MTVHIQVRQALAGLAGDRVFPLVADEGVATPYIVFQVIGGDPFDFISGEKPEKRQRRVQLRVWSKTITEATTVADQVEDALRAATELQAQALTIPIDTFDEGTNYRGTMQDFYLFC